MQDTTLVAIALSVSALGIILLQYALIVVAPLETPIPAVASFADGTPVLLEGRLVDVQHRGNLTILKVEQPATIDVVFFEQLEVEADCVRIRGKKDTYNGPQVIGSRVEHC
ncbi:MAG: hypothetical protein OXR66_00950 [Candidatus Woesearchaeota archaeon]|nr:hypothetical protein [Candidatus Woesearchaeota archaeon]